MSVAPRPGWEMLQLHVSHALLFADLSCSLCGGVAIQGRRSPHVWLVFITSSRSGLHDWCPSLVCFCFFNVQEIQFFPRSEFYFQSGISFTIQSVLEAGGDRLMKFWVFGDGIRKFWRLVSTHAWRDDLLGSLWHPSFSLDIRCPLFEPTRAGTIVGDNHVSRHLCPAPSLKRPKNSAR